MDTIYLFCSSEDSKSLHPDNSNFDFTIELSDPLDKSYVVALTEFTCSSITENLYVLCDIVESSFCRDQYLPLLRIVRNNGEFHSPQFFRCSRSNIQRVRFSIRDHWLNVPTNEIGTVVCTLKLMTI